MGKTSKIRFAAFAFIFGLLCMFAASYVYEFHFNASHLPGAEDVGDIYIDGSDFTGISKLFTEASMGIVKIIIAAVYCIIIFAASALIMLIFRLVSIRKASEITEKEYSLSKIYIWVCTALAYFISLCITSFSHIFYAFFIFFPIPLFAFLIYVLPLRSRRVTANNKTEQ